jgi:hypothetical protein
MKGGEGGEGIGGVITSIRFRVFLVEFIEGNLSVPQRDIFFLCYLSIDKLGRKMPAVELEKVGPV